MIADKTLKYRSRFFLNRIVITVVWARKCGQQRVFVQNPIMSAPTLEGGFVSCYDIIAGEVVMLFSDAKAPVVLWSRVLLPSP